MVGGQLVSWKHRGGGFAYETHFPIAILEKIKCHSATIYYDLYS